jgi:hypothetical protein
LALRASLCETEDAVAMGNAREMAVAEAIRCGYRRKPNWRLGLSCLEGVDLLQEMCGWVDQGKFWDELVMGSGLQLNMGKWKGCPIGNLDKMRQSIIWANHPVMIC